MRILHQQQNRIADLEQQLAEKDKEIERLKDTLKRTEKAMHEEVKEHLEYYNADQKRLRHQICQEIKIAMISIEPNCSIEDMNSNLYEFTGREIYAILEQIEEGNNNE